MSEALSLQERAAPGLHEFCGKLVAQLAKRWWRILDVAAGTGSFCRRIRHMGYVNVHANDIDRDGFGAREIPFSDVDLRTNFGDRLGADRWDLVIAMETIEHMENPLHFLRECRKLLAPGGVLLLTTPNVVSAKSRSIFLRRGFPAGFSLGMYYGSGHISILPDYLLEAHMARCGFSIKRTLYVEDTVSIASARGILGRVAESMIGLLMVLSGCSMGKARGHWLVAIAVAGTGVP